MKTWKNKNKQNHLNKFKAGRKPSVNKNLSSGTSWMEDTQVQEGKKKKKRCNYWSAWKCRKGFLPAETWPGSKNRTLSSIQVVRAHMLRDCCFSTFLKLQTSVKCKIFHLENKEIEINQGKLQGKAYDLRQPHVS